MVSMNEFELLDLIVNVTEMISLCSFAYSSIKSLVRANLVCVYEAFDDIECYHVWYRVCF